ncbi:MAG: methylated-DNA--[protein]-cysteine S-methyltransferase [Candidatus Accumulibacter sp.]|jgi:methylated-DNA-[protein]-cysteine S-methyltransferase|nr:methylated-DNA--[protein]-cysteine S-methyltransferase [Accumulibacter sp.]
MSKLTEKPFQAVVAAPAFCIGVRCDETEILALQFLSPRAERSPTNALAAEAVRQLRTYLADADFVFALPLQPAGTRFQRRVWEQIARIPNRQTQTYGELAKAVKSAPRAVGQACGANPYPLAVPCHRVIAAGGGLGGFAKRGGEFFLEIKRWLLAHEHSH